MSKRTYQCDFCGRDFESYPSLRKGSKCYCSKKCKQEHQKEIMKGENNPNYGNKWDEEAILKASNYMKEVMKDPDRRYMSGSANRGKRFDKQRRANISNGHKGLYHKPHTDESKKKIGEKSKAKWTQEYKQEHRKKMEELGIWTPLDQLSDIEVYYEESNWTAKMFDIITDERLKYLGVWHLYNNKNGLVRDHKYSRKSGFSNRVFPEILRHPINCRLITHSENVSNAQKENGRYEDVITLEELFLGIINYKDNWIEQDLCIMLIESYKIGNRWYNKFKKGESA